MESAGAEDIVLLPFCRVDERVSLMCALFLMAFSFFILLPMGDEPPDLAITGNYHGHTHTYSVQSLNAKSLGELPTEQP